MPIASSARITKSTIASQPYANLFNLINNRSNVPDPADSTGVRHFVFVRMPRIGRNFPGFPFIVMQRTQSTKGISTASLTKSLMSYDAFIQVYTQDKDSDSSGIPNGAEQNETISNDIIETLNNAANRKTLINQRMANMEFNIDTDEDEFEGKSVFISEFDVRFNETLLTTS